MADRDGSYKASSGGSPYMSDEKSDIIVTPAKKTPPVKKKSDEGKQSSELSIGRLLGKEHQPKQQCHIEVSQ